MAFSDVWYFERGGGFCIGSIGGGFLFLRLLEFGLGDFCP